MPFPEDEKKHKKMKKELDKREREWYSNKAVRLRTAEALALKKVNEFCKK